ncbi:uncharacterized protein LOC124860714 [Girardinichthys multiradiatus]|uniref:uncharacterized protein LOC124860714 n=1 Tax=Girardinichthys multiradiatus TaxID=208333 RepID=UPI001FADE0AC|nr:uncharacterized protein LOC124860714 [Girardinichthys multiradiatus]
MAAAVGLLLLLLGVSQGLAAHCDGRNYGARCDVTVGETVFLQLVANLSEIPRFELKKEQSIILIWRINNIVTNTIQDRSVFIPNNATFIINNLIQSDSGEYKLEIFGLDGKSTENWTLHLNVEGNSLVRIGVIAAVFCVVSVCLITSTVIYTLQKKQLKKEDGDPDDLTYAVVTTVPQPDRRLVKEKVEEEVEYGQIKSAG